MIDDIDALAMFMDAPSDTKMGMVFALINLGPFNRASDELERQMLLYLVNRLGMALGVGEMPDEHDA